MNQQKTARIYLRVSTKAQDLERQESIITDAQAQSYYIAGVYREKASGINTDRPELQRMLAELQPGDAIISERLDRLSRLPLPQAEALIKTIQDKGARLAIPGVVDLSEISITLDPDSTAAIVLADTQRMLLRIMLKAAHEDYETRRKRAAEGIALAKAAGKYKGRSANTTTNNQIVKLRGEGVSIKETASRLNVSPATVKRVWAQHQKDALLGV
ncbi:recombinase family protein [Salmonella enterica]|nr:resolvase [Salmonella enterica]EHA9546165.1 recombinase family protein [Salmonella enterica subsp. enterica serovar Braenderup]EBH4941547.1 resolvase [Salmonella enterica]ECK3278471.1 helix-turn-helix domain-containing protein [Salmonella enterica]ECK6358139.1 helix-turn-helix domain-containing protein [Salmonella enterica]